MNKYLALLFVSLLFGACENVVDLEQEPTQGTADFTKYVAIGNSLTAGYADGGVSAESQMYSYPSMIAKQIQAVGGAADFKQPTMPGNGSGYLSLTALVNGSPTLTPVPADPNAWTKVAGPFHNMGVPGIRVLDVTVAGYGASATAGNPYFFRMLPGATDMTSYLAAVAATDPTFFTCWLGNNDVLGYATSGGAFGVNGNPGTFINGITPTPLFKASYEGLINTLLADGKTKGILATIPNVTDIPFFTTVPGKFLPLPQATADALNAGYAGYNAGANGWNAFITANGLPETMKRPNITFVAGANWPVIADATLPDTQIPDGAGGFINLPKMRQLVAGELVLLTLPQAQVPTGLGSQIPVPSQYILTAKEIASIAAAVNDYNTVIKNMVSGSGGKLAIWDANAAFATFKVQGLSENGVNMSAAFISGGAFSLDGVHATPRGYAWAANRFIQITNATFGSNIPSVSISQYRGVKFP